MAGRCLGELVRKMGDRILAQIVPILKQGMVAESAATRQVGGHEAYEAGIPSSRAWWQSRQPPGRSATAHKRPHRLLFAPRAWTLGLTRKGSRAWPAFMLALALHAVCAAPRKAVPAACAPRRLQGVCNGLKEVLENATRHQIAEHLAELLPAIQGALCDPDPATRQVPTCDGGTWVGRSHAQWSQALRTDCGSLSPSPLLMHTHRET